MLSPSCTCFSASFLMIVVLVHWASTTTSSITSTVQAFAVIGRPIHFHQATAPSSTTRLYLEDWVADMIDKEYYRQQHKDEFEHEFTQALLSSFLATARSDNNFCGVGALDDERIDIDKNSNKKKKEEEKKKNLVDDNDDDNDDAVLRTLSRMEKDKELKVPASSSVPVESRVRAK